MAPSRGERQVAEASLRPLTEAERALWLDEAGEKVREHRGRHWVQPAPGFWRPVHILARLTAEQATKPARASWGFRAALRDEDASAANVAAPIHWLERLEDHSEDDLSANRRYQLRKSRRLVDFVQVTEPDRLVADGYAVARSALERTGFRRPPSRQQFEREIEVGLRRGGLYIAGLVDGKLAGYVSGFAVGDVAYLDEVNLATEQLSTQISIGIQFAFVEVAKRSPGVTQLVHGVHAVDDEKLSSYKERIGFPIRRVPARLWLLRGAPPLLRRAAPHVYYRWTGEIPARAAA
jgi:hypothetical protein